MWHLSGTPYEVQNEAFRRGQGKKAHGHLMEPGLGKTGVLLNEVVESAINDEIAAQVVMMPPSLLGNWGRECEKMGFPGNYINFQDLKPGKEMQALKGKELPLIGINFESLVTPRGEAFLDEVHAKFHGRVGYAIDESSKIKHHTSKRSAAALYRGLRAANKRIMTGSVLTHSPMDLYPQFKFIDAIRLRPWAFKSRFCVMGGFGGKQVVGVRHEDELARMIEQHAFLAYKKDWTDLPEKQYRFREVSMTKRQRGLYQEIAEDFYAMIDGVEIDVDMAITQMIKLQQITSGFIIPDEGDPIDLCGPGKNPRINDLKDVLDETTGKTIVYTYFSWTAQRLAEELKDWNPAMLIGKTKAPEGYNFDENVNKFNEESSCRVTVNQVSAGGIGLTLIGDQSSPQTSCSDVVYYEQTFNREDRVQTEDRIHRHGQGLMCNYTDFVSSPFDVKVIESLERKAGMSANILQHVDRGDFAAY